MGDSRNVRGLWNSAIVMFTTVKQLRMIWGLLVLGIIAALVLDFGLWQGEAKFEKPFPREDGFAYIVPGFSGSVLPVIFGPHGDDLSDNWRSRLRLFENGKPFPHPHTLHAEIRQTGNGRYSHWGNAIIFAPSRNVDPNAPGFELTAVYPLTVRPEVKLALLALAVVLGVIAFPSVRAAFSGQNLIRLLLCRGRMSDRVYWGAFGVLFTAGLALRTFWTVTLGAPYITPDSFRYVHPAVVSLAFPISERRVPGTPYLVSLGVTLFHHPVGILVMQNLVWVISTLAITLTLDRKLKLRFWSLAVLAYLVFNPKNLAFEYLAMSEHASRTLYLIYFAALIASLGAKRWLWVGPVLAVAVLANILVKPSAVVLVPATLIYFAILALWPLRGRRSWIAANAVIFAAIVSAGVAAYGLAFKDRFGTFNLTNFTGFALFCHVGHLTDLKGGKYPTIKRELAEFLPRYVENFANRGEFKPNWLCYGSVDDELSAAFGDRSPWRTIREYVDKRPGEHSWLARVNAIYVDLAIEGIRANLGPYLAHAARQATLLFIRGPTWGYGNYFRPESLEKHETDYAKVVKWLGPLADAAPPRPPHVEPRVRRQADGVYQAYRMASTAVAAAGTLAIFVVVLVGGLGPLITRRLWIHGPRTPLQYHRLVAFAMAVVIVLGYGAFLGLVNMAEAPRFLVNVQDLMVVAGVLAAALTVQQWRRIVLRLARRGSGFLHILKCGTRR